MAKDRVYPAARPQGKSRRYWVGAALYVIRDLFCQGKFYGCEFAQRNPNGSKRWLSCPEGSEFADIEPLRYRGVV